MRPSFLRPRDRGNHKESATCPITKARSNPHFHIPLIFFVLNFPSHAVSEIFSLSDTFSHVRNFKCMFNLELLYHKDSNMFRPLNKVKPCSTGLVLGWAGLLIFHAVAELRISSKSAKSREIHKNTRNPAKFAKNLTKYMSAQHI